MEAAESECIPPLQVVEVLVEPSAANDQAGMECIPPVSAIVAWEDTLVVVDSPVPDVSPLAVCGGEASSSFGDPCAAAVAPPSVRNGLVRAKPLPKVLEGSRLETCKFGMG